MENYLTMDQRYTLVFLFTDLTALNNYQSACTFVQPNYMYTDYRLPIHLCKPRRIRFVLKNVHGKQVVLLQVLF